MFQPVSVQYSGECMESILNIDNGIEELAQVYDNCNIRILDGYVKVRESLYTWVMTPF